MDEIFFKNTILEWLLKAEYSFTVKVCDARGVEKVTKVQFKKHVSINCA